MCKRCGNWGERMRLMPIEYLKEGEIIAKDIISYEGGILLRHDTRFKEVFKSKLIERGILEVYIEDEISEGINPREIIEPIVKQRMTQDMKKQFDKLKDSFKLDVNTISEMSIELIDQLNQKELILELDDLRTNDDYTYEHCLAVSILTTLVCNKMNIDTAQKQKIVMGAMIHDIGKIIIPKDILNKPTSLSKEEYEMIKSHAQIGYKMIKDHSQLSPITKLAVLCHHEREDGSGYPLGKGEELHIGTKIVAACDLYHALISDRCYRKGLPIHEAISIGQREPIHPEVRTIIENLFAYYPVGCLVELNDGRIGIVEKNISTDIKRPIIRIIDKENGKLVAKYKLNLQNEEQLYIVGRYYERLY